MQFYTFSGTKVKVSFTPETLVRIDLIKSYNACALIENSSNCIVYVLVGVFVMKMMPPTAESMFFSQASRCLLRHVETLYTVLKRDECGWGITLKSTSSLYISQAPNQNRDLQLWNMVSQNQSKVHTLQL